MLSPKEEEYARAAVATLSELIKELTAAEKDPRSADYKHDCIVVPILEEYQEKLKEIKKKHG